MDSSTTSASDLETIWYTSRDGKTKGPFSFAEIIEQISSSRLTLLDLIFSEALGEWKMMSEVRVFQETFQTRAIGRVRTNEQNRGEWIVLKARGANESVGSSHVLGPFHQNEIFEMITSGELSYSDSVWKPGEDEWVRLGDHVSFDRRTKVKENPTGMIEFSADTSVIDQIPRQEILVNVAKMKRAPLAPAPEEVPDGAAGLDLAKKFIFSLIIGSCLAGGVLATEFASAHTLELAALKSGTAKPLLMLQTDAPVGTVIHVELTVALGDVPGVPVFSKSLDVKREAGEVPTIDVQTLGLPKGTFHVAASIEGSQLKKTVTFFNGEADQSFRLNDATYAKEVSLQQQTEKKAIFYSSKKLADLAKKLRVNYPKLARNSTRRKAFYLRWAQDLKEAEDTVAQLPVSDGVALPEERSTFSELVAALKSEGQKLGIRSVAEIESTDRSVASVSGDEKGAAAALSKLEKSFDKLKEQASLASAND